jgi:PTH1 family peptidyl-tRNA hydrolase
MKPSLIIVGLGNPGASYALSRHNAGFQALDTLSGSFGEGAWKEKQKFLALVQEARFVTIPVLLIKPLTFMNRSGESVKKIIDFFKIDPSEQLLVLCDDIDLPLGDLRLRRSGGPGTHNGLKSIVETIGEAFPRLRIGLGVQPIGMDLAAWVLSVPPAAEREALQQAFTKIPDIVKDYILNAENTQQD